MPHYPGHDSVSVIWILIFEIVSNFDIRISNFITLFHVKILFAQLNDRSRIIDSMGYHSLPETNPPVIGGDQLVAENLKTFFF